MHLNRSDRDKLIIVGVLITIIALVFFVFHFTRFIPLKYIAIIFITIMFIESAVISVKYLRVYDADTKVVPYIPIINSISTFPTVLAWLLIINSCLCVLALCLQFVPASLYAKFNLDTALSVSTGVGVFLIFTLLIESVIYGLGYCSIMRDIKGMLYEVTGAKSSSMDLVHYPLLLVPLLNTLSMSVIITLLNKLERYNYHVGDVVDEGEELYEEE